MSIRITLDASEAFTDYDPRTRVIMAEDYVSITYGRMTIDDDTFIASVSSEGLWATTDDLEWTDLTITIDKEH